MYFGASNDQVVHQLPVLLGELERGLDRFTASGEGEHAAEITATLGGEVISEFDRVRVSI